MTVDKIIAGFGKLVVKLERHADKMNADHMDHMAKAVYAANERDRAERIAEKLNSLLD